MRIRNMARNSFFALASQVILIVFGFLSNRILNLKLGEAIVGVNSVSNNILGILSVTELGFSSALVFHLYSVIAEKDEDGCARLLNMYRMAYRGVALVIAILGMIVLPFVHVFMKGSPFEIAYVRLVFLLWLIKTVASYLLSYRRSILIADQKAYIVSLVTMTASMLGYISVIVIVSIFGNYILALLFSVLFETTLSISLNIYIDKNYPFLVKYRRLKVDKEIRDSVFSDTKNIFISKLGQRVFTSTDSVIISGMVGVSISGLFSNYIMVLYAVVNMVITLGNALQPSVADKLLEKNSEKDEWSLRQISFLFFLIACSVTASCINLLNLFIGEIWLGARYLMTYSVVLLACINAAIQMIGFPMEVFLNAAGMFRQDRDVVFSGAFINLILSLILVGFMGVEGVVVGSIIGNTYCFIGRVYFFFKDHIGHSVNVFLLDELSYAGLLILESALCFMLCPLISIGGVVVTFICRGILCVGVPLLINMLVFIKSKRLRSIIGMVKLLKK